MPSNLKSFTFFSNRTKQKKQEGDGNERITRPSSLSIDWRIKEEKETGQSEPSPQAKQAVNSTSPLHRFTAFGNHRRYFSRSRSQTISTQPRSTTPTDNGDLTPLCEEKQLNESTVASDTNRRQNSFREAARSIFFTASIQRSNSLASGRRKKSKRTQPQAVSPLVSSRARSFPQPGQRLVMGRHIANACMSGPIGTRDEESAPASVESFVRKCADCFDASGRCSNEHFLRVLFLTHSWFMTSEQLMILFLKLYEEEKTMKRQRIKVFFTIRFWMNEFPQLFDIDKKLVEALNELRALSSNDSDVDKSLIDLDNKRPYKWTPVSKMSIRQNHVDRKQRKVSLVFNHLEPEEIAIHMSFLEYNSFRRLTLGDFQKYAMNGVIKDNLKLERAVFLFNNITHWVQCMVLDHHSVNDRAAAVVKFVEVAKKLHAMRNFNTLMAIVGALTHTAISRLKKTMAEVPKATQKTLDEFVELLDSKFNYSAYRRAYSHVTEEFKIPVIGILMKDFTALHAALPDRVGDGLINVRKMMIIGRNFEEIYRLQRLKYPHAVNRDLVNTLRVSLYLYYNEEEIYQLSVRREPRDIKYSASGVTSSPIKTVNMGFAEFASFSCQVEDGTIKQHVTAMANSVFKTYDVNSDGFISESEFASFVQNFPGLDPFATVDKDQDGRISKDEMVEYFLKISSTRRSQVCQNFKHDFVETTYFHPTFCEECAKLLWGLVKQGWKCKDCGINCHKHCKDRIVQECRSKTESKNSPNTPLNASKKRDKRKEKASLSSESDISVNGENAKLIVHDDDTFEMGDAKSAKALKKKKKKRFSGVNHDGSDKATSESTKEQQALLSSPTLAPKASSPSLSSESGRRFRPFHLLLKKHSTKLNVAVPSSPVLEPGRRLTSPFKRIHRKARSFENVSELKRAVSIDVPAENFKELNAKTKTVRTAAEPNAAAANGNALNSQHCANERHDSGVSCSCSGVVTPSTSSTPPTPLSTSELASMDLRFQYPPASGQLAGLKSTGEDSCTVEERINNNNNDNTSIYKHNTQLLLENQQLRRQLDQAQDVISDLETKLSTLTPTS